MLRDELDVEPMAETQALLAAIAQGAVLPVSSPSSPPLLAARREESIPRLIGRETEMTELAALWERAAAGHGRMVIVSGQAGIDKSHLAFSLADYAARRGGLALVGHCYEFERALPYQAIVEVLRSAANLLQHAQLAPAHRAPLARLAPDMLDVIGGLDDALAVTVADHLFAETAGNPFFLQEVVGGLIETELIVVVGEQWSGPFVKAAPGVQVSLPASLRETINARQQLLIE